VYVVAAEVLGEVRKAKTAAQRSLRTEATRVVVRDTAERLAALGEARGDVQEAARALDLEPTEAEEFSVEVELAPDTEA
jgi:valyl-tRNA synthetase